jgi:UDP-N-acetylglucosamine:LPS N-acetylglucosamine transferase
LARGVLILSAGIGEGHDLPARWLAAGLAQEAPGVEVAIADGLAAMGPVVERVVMGGSAFHSRLGNLLFDVEHWLLTRVPAVRAFAGWAPTVLGGRGLLWLIAQHEPAVVVSTYPGTTEVLGRLRERGRLEVPVVSAITDLASLRFWAQRGVDLHLVTHPESVEEVRAVAGSKTDVAPVRGLHDPAFLSPPARAGARRALGLPPDAPVVVVSGGGWGVGDIDGAVDTALAVEDALVLVMCGRNDALRERVESRQRDAGRVRALGFVDNVAELFSAADALVHSTAGLTVLEAHMCGCPTISYGWGRGHIRANNRAFRRFALADVARTRSELDAALRRALAGRASPAAQRFAALPSAAALIRDRFGLADRHAGHEA